MLEIKKMRLPIYGEISQLDAITKRRRNLSMHWQRMYSWCLNKQLEDERFCAACGYFSGKFVNWVNSTYRYSTVGVRPVFEPVDPDSLGLDGSVITVGTLFMDGQPVKIPRKPTEKGDIPDYIPGSMLELRDCLEDSDYQVRAIKVGDVLIADRVIVKNISWGEALRAAPWIQKPESTGDAELDTFLLGRYEKALDPSDEYAKGYFDASVTFVKAWNLGGRKT